MFLMTVIISFSIASHTQLSASSTTNKKSKTQVRPYKQDFDLPFKCFLDNLELKEQPLGSLVNINQ